MEITTKNQAPTIGIICCRKDIEGQPGQAVHEKYIGSITRFGGVPILLPSGLMNCADITNVLSSLDGILLTGSYSNVVPARYGAQHDEPCTDEYRDTLSFALLDYAVSQNMPVFAVCRGLQEMNVYFGGTLYPDLSVNPAFVEKHKEDAHSQQEEQYAAAHDIHIAPDGMLSKYGTSYAVNSLHKQAIKELAPQLRIEATSPDGLIEAISHPHYDFILGVQWHPEWKPEANKLSCFLFTQFIERAQNYGQQQ